MADGKPAEQKTVDQPFTFEFPAVEVGGNERLTKGAPHADILLSRTPEAASAANVARQQHVTRKQAPKKQGSKLATVSHSKNSLHARRRRTNNLQDLISLSGIVNENLLVDMHYDDYDIPDLAIDDEETNDVNTVEEIKDEFYE